MGVKDTFFNLIANIYYHYCSKCKEDKKCLKVVRLNYEESKHYLECGQTVIIDIETNIIKD